MTKDKVETHIDKPNRKDNQKNPDKISNSKVKSSDKETKRASSDKSREKSTPVGKSSTVGKTPTSTNRTKGNPKDKPVAKVSGKTKQINGKTPDNIKVARQKNSTVQDAKKKANSKTKIEKVERKGILVENGEDEVVINTQNADSDSKIVKKEAKVKRTKSGDSAVVEEILKSKTEKSKTSKKRKRPDDETSFDEDALLKPSSDEVVTPAAVDSVTSSGKRERKKKKFWDDEVIISEVQAKFRLMFIFKEFLFKFSGPKNLLM